MRILHAVHNYLPEQTAGVEVYTNRLATRQVSKNPVGILFASFDPNRDNGSILHAQDAGIETFSLAQNRFWTRFEHTYLDPKMARGIGEVFDEFRPDIIHVQHLLNLGLSLVQEARRRKIPLVMTLHDHWFACANGGQRFRADRRRCDELDASQCGRCIHALVAPAIALRGARQRRRRQVDLEATRQEPSPDRSLLSAFEDSARSTWAKVVGLGGAERIHSRWRTMLALEQSIDSFIAPSTDMLEAAVAFGFSRDRIRHLAHGIPSPDTLPPVRQSDRPFRFGYVGSLVPHKGVHDLVVAFNDLPGDVTLDLHGSLLDAPDYITELRALSRHPGIRFLGERAPSEVFAVMRELDCLVAPSIWRENAPLGVQEAFSAGTPVIASNLGGHKELLAAGGGLLFEAGDVQSLRSALRRFVDDDGLRESLIATIPEPRSMQDHIGDLMALYGEVVERSRDV